MQLPRWVEIKTDGHVKIVDGKASIGVSVRVPWWGWPILLWQTVRRSYALRWYHWPLVPLIVLVAWVKALYRGWSQQRMQIGV